MIRTSKSIAAALYAGTALFTISGATPVLAQTQPQPPSVAGIEEIVVTARRREESLQDVPISVSAFSGENLDKQGAPDITTLQKYTPNLTLQVARGSNSTLIAFIRGVGQQDPLWGFEPGVGLYVDDVYVARPQGAVLDIFDIERVEVLRGPQGTLYGRNTIGGAVKYVTRKIGDEARGTVKASVGSYGQRDFVVSAGAPVTDKIGVSGAFALYKRDGYGENRTTGADHYDKDVKAGRLALEFTPTENTFFRLSADKTDDDSNARHGHRLRPLTGFPVLDDVYDTRAGLGDDNRVMTQGVSLLGEVELNDRFTLKSITAYREGETDTNIDFDNTPNPILDVPALYRDDQFSQELQVLFSGERVQGVAGIYYMDANASGAFDTILGGANLTIATSGEVKTKSYAAFADFSFDITDQLKASLGGRYTVDEKTGTVFRANYAGIRSPLLGGAERAASLVRTNYTNEKDFKEFTPRVSLSYEATDDVTVYGSYGRGFKSGGFDMRGDAIFTPDTVNGYEPEIVDTYELGMKTRFLDGRVALNLAGFYSKYDGQQVTTQVPATNGIASFVDNVGKSEIKGFEAEGNIALTDAFSAQVSLGWIDADFEEFLRYNLTTRQYDDIANQVVFQNTPEWTGSLSLTYVHDMGSAGTITAIGSASYRDDYSQFEFPNAELDQDAFTLLDLSLVWTAENDAWRVGLHGKNLTDKEYRIGGYNFVGALFGDSVIGFYGPPRTFTATLEYRF